MIKRFSAWLQALLLSGGILLSPLQAHADPETGQASPDDTRSFTLSIQEVVHLPDLLSEEQIPLDLPLLAKTVMLQNLDVQQKKLDLALVKTQKWQEASNFLPSIKGLYRQSRFQGGVQVFNGDPQKAFITNIQPEVRATLPLSGKAFLDVLVLKQKQLAAGWEVQLEIQKQLERACQEYFDFIKAQQTQKISEVLLEEAKTDVARQQARLEQGVGVKVDVLQAKTFFFQQNDDLLKAESDLQNHQLALAQQLQLPIGAKFQLPESATATLHWFQDSISPESLLAQARHQHPALLQAKAKLAQMKASQKAVLAGLFPTVNLSAYLNGIGKQYNNLDFSRFAGLEVNIDLLKNMGVFPSFEIKKAALALHAAQLLVQQTDSQINQEMKQALIAFKTAQKRYDFSKEAMMAAEEAYQQSQARFNLGLAEHLEVLKTQSDWVKTKSKQLEAAMDLNMAQIKLAAAMGTLDTYLLNLAVAENTPNR